MAKFLPLPTLLSQSLVAFTIEFDNEAERRIPHYTTRHGATKSTLPKPWLASIGSFQWLQVSKDEVLDPRCQALRREDSTITFPVPLFTLGTTQSKVLKTLGSPTARDSKRLIYLHAHANGSFVSSNAVIVRLRNGVVWAIQASKTTSD